MTTTTTSSTSSTSIGLLQPGEMGAAIGAVLAGAGHRVVWASQDRSDATRERARAVGLEDLGTPARVAAEADVVLSVCPPAAAMDTAESLGAYSGVYVDANAVSPSTARAIGRVVSRAGASFVDGGLIGQPPVHPGDVRLYLSGDAAAGRVAALFEGTAVDARVLDDAIGSASALKCGYAAWTKGTIALLLAVRRYAQASGTEEALLEEWAESIPDLAARSERSAASARAKGWRWVAEMREIAAAFEAAGLPAGFHAAAAEVFAKLPPDVGGQKSDKSDKSDAEGR